MRVRKDTSNRVPWGGVVGGVAMFLAWSSSAGELNVEGDLAVTGYADIEGGVVVGQPASSPTEAVRKGEMEPEIARQVGTVLPELRQAPNTLGVAQNFDVTATGGRSHAEGGYYNSAEGTASHVEGEWFSRAEGNASHAEGLSPIAEGDASHAQGLYSYSWGPFSHAEGYGADAGGAGSHAEGAWAAASGTGAHAEGPETIAAGRASHAEGYATTVGGAYAHAEGTNTVADGRASHAGGGLAYAIHDHSFIHATGAGYDNPKVTQYPDTAHFDKLYTFETWGEFVPGGAILNKEEADLRYGHLNYIPRQGDVLMGIYSAE